jgi:HK97 family phage prohead protease
MATDDKKPYGDVKYADPKNGKYPVDTESHARAALSYFSMPKNQAGYSPEEVKAIMGRIKAACRRFGIQLSDDERSLDSTDPATDGIERIFTSTWQPKLGMPVEVRANGKSSREIGGYAAVFDRESENLGTFVERVSRSCFNSSRADGWPGVICRFNHDDSYVLGTTQGHTLRVWTDETGLQYTVDVPEHRGDVLELVARGDVANSSFAFIAHEVDWGYSDQGYPTRTLLQAKLIDVAPVTVPAYRSTTAALRGLSRYLGVPFEDVIALQEKQELRKLFIRTDVPLARKPITGRAAKLQLLEKQYVKPAL